jgi:hypothetical protein
MWAAAALAHRGGGRTAAALFLASGTVYLCGGLLLTMLVNVPMNADRPTRHRVNQAPDGHGRS